MATLNKTLQLYIYLERSDPKIWRCLLLPAIYTFYQLHMAIQAAFGWEYVHLFQFGDRGLMYDKKAIGIPCEESDTDISDARKINLNQIFKKKKDECLYIYDFGDNWEHKIVLEKILDKEMYEAYCIDGANECPPEDVGGMHGYHQMLECFANGSKREKKEYRDWLGITSDWEAGTFKLREVNKRLALVKKDVNWNDV